MGRTPSTIDLDVQSGECVRCLFCRVSGVSVGTSPAWLREKLEAIGQRSISDIVDLTNYAMLETGQPMHAFDLDKLVAKDGRYSISLKAVAEETKITVLGGKELVLPPGTLVFTDENREGYNILDIAGMKGGVLAEVDANTTNIALTAANFNPSYIRRFSKAIGVATDATKRNENGVTPELALIGMEFTIAEIAKLMPSAKSEEVAEARSGKPSNYKLGVSASEVNRLLGTEISEEEIAVIMDRFGFEWLLLEPRETMVATARQHVGKPYRLGASVTKDAPNEFDCSSFTSWLAAQAGIVLPRVSVDQFVWSDKIGESEVKPGDLVFSNSGTGKIHFETFEWLKGAKVPEGVDHVGLCVGDGQVIHASRHNGTGSVGLEKISESEQFKNIVGYGRIVRNEEKRFVIAVPHERLDLRLKEDLIEEIGRAYGYDKIPTKRLAAAEAKPAVNKALSYSETIRETLRGLGFSEIRTYAFRDKGEVAVANPLASDKGFLISNLADNMDSALESNARYADLLGSDDVKLFEIGKVFSKKGEHISLSLGAAIARTMKKKDEAERQIVADAIAAVSSALGIELSVPDGRVAEFDLDSIIAKLPEPVSYSAMPILAESVRYKAFSPFPFVLRDIAVWVPESVAEADVLADIVNEAGVLLVKSRIFDVFSKEIDGAKKTSYAFRLVFQSDGKTLTDDEVNEIMARITGRLDSNNGWTVR